jgi:uncharacterized protein YecE (DUF72 family)
MLTSLIGTAGWSVARSNGRFAQEGTALERYASVFSAVEVNSSFYRRHKPETWGRWRDSVPSGFRFAVKMPKTITHERRFVDAQAELDVFFADIATLEDKLGAVLVQLAPSFAFDEATAGPFFAAAAKTSPAPLYLEPRHPTWAEPQASELLQRHHVGRVYADPQDEQLRSAAVAEGPRYFRMHGSPRVYYSAYSKEHLDDLRTAIVDVGQPCWCIFDNTASGAALDDALTLFDRLGT